MSTTLYFNTGTGNSLWTARKLAHRLDDTELVAMVKTGKERVQPIADCVGLIFPVHIWGLPLRVTDFVNRMEIDPGKYCFAIAVNAGQVAATLVQLKKLLEIKGMLLSSGFSLCMPSNYIPWGSAPPAEKQQILFRQAEEKIARIAESVRIKEQKAPEKGPLWQNVIFTALNRFSTPYIPEMDKSFWTDDKCNACRICEQICPNGNIVITEGKPVWTHRCEQCLACIQWCPQEAIQFGKSTPKKKRYHHPEITIGEIIACAE